MILLTEDEMEEPCNYGEVAKAQLKKVVEYIESRPWGYEKMESLLGDDWNSIKKEAGI